jgi:hypothetical protein
MRKLSKNRCCRNEGMTKEGSRSQSGSGIAEEWGILVALGN